MGERIGVLGGAFDPPHVGHAIVALEARERLRLDRLLIVPASDPPHRETAFGARLRYELVSQLFAGVQGLEVSDLELERPGPSYTVDTLRSIRAERHPDELFCIFGSDQLELLDSWHDFRRLPEVATLAVMTRPGQALELPVAASGIPYITVDIPGIEVSSTGIRERLGAGRSIRFLVPEVIRETVERAWADLTQSDTTPAALGARGRTNIEGE